LVERVRDLLDDYGDVTHTLAANVTDTSGTSLTLSGSDDVAAGDYISVDFETMLVTAMSSGPAYTCTVRRGQRGTTAATHSSGATVIVNPLYPGNRIFYCLNAALGKLTKVVKDTSTLTVTEDTFAYAIPSTIDTLWRVEIENSDEDSEFYVIRNWELLDGSYFRIFGNYDTDRNIACVGTAKFTALTTSGNLDTSFPDDNQNAINFLVYEAAGQLLLQRQGKIAGRDSFVGMTDAFAQTYPDHSVRVARQYLAEAERYRLLATRAEHILQTPQAPTQDPTRKYLERL
jgi:hypothetical protein